jgi:predicted amidohydrolase
MRRTNLKEIRRMLGMAGQRRSDLVLFGEYANVYHRMCLQTINEHVRDDIPGSFTRMVASAARQHRMNVVMPILGEFHNVLSSHAVVFDRSGKIAACYQKSHPTEQEQGLGIRAGNALPVIELDCAKVGIMTCMDIEYPEVAQVLMLRGAEVLLFPHVQAGWGEVDWEIRYRARAIDTGLYLVSACYGYPEGEWLPGKMVGRSGVVGRDGLILAELGREIGVLTIDMDLDRKRVTNFFFNEPYDRTPAVMASRRPEIYSDLVDLSHKQRAFHSLRKRGK